VNLVDVYSQEPHQVLYQLLEERTSEEAISHQYMPSYAEHIQFVRERPYRAWYLLQDDGVIGAVSVNDRNEIRVGIIRSRKTPALVREAILAITRLHQPLKAIPSDRVGRYVMNVNPANTDLAGVLDSMGAVHIQSTYAL
jgi:hypothetical protein